MLVKPVVPAVRAALAGLVKPVVPVALAVLGNPVVRVALAVLVKQLVPVLARQQAVVLVRQLVAALLRQVEVAEKEAQTRSVAISRRQAAVAAAPSLAAVGALLKPRAAEVAVA